jgi:3-deoxy-D-manno-octulosonic-acid transferase
LFLFFYNIFLLGYQAGIRLVALFNPKARKWVNGRKNIFQNLQAAVAASSKIIWFHCSSLGEFEQGRPVLEKIKLLYPEHKILLTFFSPSGYEAQKNYKEADWIFYLPMDGPSNAKKFLELTHPSLVIFVKYEFWYYYLKQIKQSAIPLLLISAFIRENHSVFSTYEGFKIKMLSFFDYLFLQDAASKKITDKAGLAHKSLITGDSRFDRVIEIANNFQTIPGIDSFVNGHKVLVAGSTWPEDERLLSLSLKSPGTERLKIILAPHEITKKYLDDTRVFFPEAVLYSDLIMNREPVTSYSDVLIIDNIGMLASLYNYATIAYVGGGLKKSGVHNVLEPAVFFKPVIFGPFYQKYQEATGLVEKGGAFVINDENDFTKFLLLLLKNSANCYDVTSKAAGKFVTENAGATEKIVAFIQEKRLLTN